MPPTGSWQDLKVGAALWLALGAGSTHGGDAEGGQRGERTAGAGRRLRGC
jgi:hypothetical protein